MIINNLHIFNLNNFCSRSVSWQIWIQFQIIDKANKNLKIGED